MLSVAVSSQPGDAVRVSFLFISTVTQTVGYNRFLQEMCVSMHMPTLRRIQVMFTQKIPLYLKENPFFSREE